MINFFLILTKLVNRKMFWYLFNRYKFSHQRKSLFNLSIHAKLANRGKVFFCIFSIHANFAIKGNVYCLLNTCLMKWPVSRSSLTWKWPEEMTSAQIRVWPGNDLDVIQIHLTGSYSMGSVPQTQTDKNIGLGWASGPKHRNEDRQRVGDSRWRFGFRERNGELPPGVRDGKSVLSVEIKS